MLKQVVTVGALGVLMSGCSMFNKSTDSIDTAQTITPFAVKHMNIRQRLLKNKLSKFQSGILICLKVMMLSMQ